MPIDHFFEIKRLKESSLGKIVARFLATKDRQQPETNSQSQNTFSLISKEIYDSVPDDRQVHAIEKQDISNESIRHLLILLQQRLKQEQAKRPSKTKEKAIQLSQDEREIWKSLLRLQVAMKNIPSLMHLLDISIIQRRKTLRVPKQKITENFQSVLTKLQDIGISIEHHSGQQEGFNKDYQPDSASTNHSKMRKEPNGKWTILTNAHSQQNAFEIAHEVYGHLFKRKKQPNKDLIELDAQDFLDTRIADTLFTQAEDPLITALLFEEDSPFEKIRSRVGHLHFFTE